MSDDETTSAGDAAILHYKKIPEREFEEIDPYNPQNVVKGIIYRTNARYGSLLIKEVNGRPCEQFVHCTPKFYYPGNVDSPRKIVPGTFPPFERITVYNKLDGTNVYAFAYRDADGNHFVSYKTRLVPFLKAAGFKDWIEMWGMMRRKYLYDLDGIEDLLKEEANGLDGIAFEMFGSANKILIDYPVPLDINVLYAIGCDGGIIEPTGFQIGQIRAPAVINKYFGGIDAEIAYDDTVAQHEVDFTSGKPVEGSVWYIDTGDGKCIAWKCKPPSVLDAQAEGSRLVSYKEAYTTAMNAMESCDSTDCLPDETYQLLAETYDETKIELSKARIDKAIADAIKYVTFRQEVVDAFKASGIPWPGMRKDSPKEIKDPVMRYMAKAMAGRGKSTAIFSALVDYYTLHGG